jgi:hypothetical protein
VLFPQSGWRKRDDVDYYLAVADATVVHLPRVLRMPGLHHARPRSSMRAYKGV